MRTAIYARVSTNNGVQDPDTQLIPLREYAVRREWEVVAEHIDQISGVKERPALNQLMKSARRRGIDCILVWKFDRFARSTRHLIEALEEFKALGIEFVSLTEGIDTSTPMGKMVYTMLAAVAELERELIRERVKAGLARAKRQGKRLGRPRGINLPVQAIRRRRKRGETVEQIADHYKTSLSTVYRALEAS